MLKYFCDRCGKHLSEKEKVSLEIFANTINTTDGWCLHICEPCLHKVMGEITNARQNGRDVDNE